MIIMPSTAGKIGMLVAPHLRSCRRLYTKLCQFFFPGFLSKKRKKKWDAWWGDETYQPFFEPSDQVPQVPPELEEAIQKEWFPPNARLLDIGCGSGWIASWLADQGFDVLGVDYAEAAIERAKKRFPDPNGKLRWQVVDIIEGVLPETDFDVLIDRGCLHRIPDASWSDYCRNVHALAKPGGKLMLMVATFDHEKFVFNEARMSEDELKKKVCGVFANHFEIDRMENGFIEFNEKMGGQHMPSVTFWMTARSLDTNSNQTIADCSATHLQ